MRSATWAAIVVWGAIGAVTIGGAAFITGFIAPLVITPGANQGPLLGFCMAPLGFVVGFMVGAILGYVERLKNLYRSLILLLSAALVIVGIVAMTLPYKNKPGYRRSFKPVATLDGAALHAT